jgi:translation initiation factor 1
MDIDPLSGLPLAVSDWEGLAKTQQEIKVTTEKRRFGKMNTLVTGLEGVDIKDVAKKLKEKLACGGTVKDKQIELQGDHRSKIVKVLVEAGFEQSQIKVK